MPVCGYLVIPEPGAAEPVARRLDREPGCEVTRSENRDLLILVTETPGPAAERSLRSRLEAMAGVQALLLTFGEIEPATEAAESSPLPEPGTRARRLPVLASPFDGPAFHPARDPKPSRP